MSVQNHRLLGGRYPRGLIFHQHRYRPSKKSLKIPKGQSETVYRRRTDKTMAKRKSTKGQTTVDKTYI